MEIKNTKTEAEKQPTENRENAEKKETKKPAARGTRRRAAANQTSKQEEKKPASAEQKQETKAEQKSEQKNEPKQEKKPEPKKRGRKANPEQKQENKTERKEESTTEQKPEQKSEVKAEQKQEPKQETKAETKKPEEAKKQEPQKETKANVPSSHLLPMKKTLLTEFAFLGNSAKAQPKQEGKVDPIPEQKQEVKPEQKSEAKPEQRIEQKPEVKAEQKEAKAEQKPEAKTEQKQEIKPAAVSAPLPAPAAVPAPVKQAWRRKRANGNSPSSKHGTAAAERRKHRGKTNAPKTKDELLKEKFIARLHALGGTYFEYYSVYLLERYSLKNGRRLESLRVSGGGDDGGIDGEIELTDKFGFREKIYIQSKNWDPTKGDAEKWQIGETLVQQFIGAVTCRMAKEGRQHSRGIFITSSKFTPDAKEMLESVSDPLYRIRFKRRIRGGKGMLLRADLQKRRMGTGRRLAFGQQGIFQFIITREIKISVALSSDKKLLDELTKSFFVKAGS